MLSFTTLASEADGVGDVSTESSCFTPPIPSTPFDQPPCISVLDVYDVAAAIGKDFEAIIDKHGPDSVASLMPKVISVLEELEDYAQRFEAEDREISTLQVAAERLEREKLERVQDREKYEKELIQIEETWQSESGELRQLVERLTHDNSELSRLLEEKAKTPTTPPVNHTTISPDITNQELQLMIRLKEIIDRQKVELRGLKRQVAQKSVDLDAMQQQANRLAKLNAELRRKHCVSKRQADQLIEDKAELELRLHAKEQLVKQMRDHVYQPSANQDSRAVSMLADMATSMTLSMTTSMTSDPGAPTINPLSKMTEEQLIKLLNSEGKMIIDTRDPSRPRFTLDELRDVLIERNELKSRLVEVEEELSVYKRAGDDDPPVQGPINREPEEKLLPSSTRKPQGIRKLFANLLSKFAQ